MNATMISTKADKMFTDAWEKLPVEEREIAYFDTLLYGVSLIEIRDDGTARRIDPPTVLAHLK